MLVCSPSNSSSVKTIDTTSFSELQSIIFADINNDGQDDLIVSDIRINIVWIFLINQIVDFNHEQTYTTGSASHPYSVAVEFHSSVSFYRF